RSGNADTAARWRILNFRTWLFLARSSVDGRPVALRIAADATKRVRRCGYTPGRGSLRPTHDSRSGEPASRPGRPLVNTLAGAMVARLIGSCYAAKRLPRPEIGRILPLHKKRRGPASAPR